MTEETPRIEVTVAAPVDAVWTALRDRDQIRHWHGWEYGENGGLDAEIDLIYHQGFTEDADTHTLEVQGGDRFVLEPAGEGTRVTLTRAPHGGDPEWDKYYDEVTEGWTTFLHQLRFALERHPGQDRRTLFLGGDTATSGSPVEALGLSAVAGLTPGTPYKAELVGEPVSGTVWFRSDHQLGLTVDSWGDGLLVLSAQAPSELKPGGAAMALLTTYGTDAPATWTPWWADRFPSAP